MSMQSLPIAMHSSCTRTFRVPTQGSLETTKKRSSLSVAVLHRRVEDSLLAMSLVIGCGTEEGLLSHAARRCKTTDGQELIESLLQIRLLPSSSCRASCSSHKSTSLTRPYLQSKHSPTRSAP